jgi:hypothetical protein
MGIEGVTKTQGTPNKLRASKVIFSLETDTRIFYETV